MADEPDVDEITVAFLAAEGMTQTAIGQRLRLSQSAVSRMLGPENRFLERRPPYLFRERLVSDRTMEAVLERASMKRLPKYLDELAKVNGQVRGPVVKVLPGTAARLDTVSEEQHRANRFMEFTRQAAPYVASLLARDSVKTCGVTWGYMLHDLCLALRQLNRPAKWKSESVQITPLSGDPLQSGKNESPALTSSNIAAELGKIINGDRYRAAWLGLVPAFIPEEFKPRDKAVIDRMVRMVPEYEVIFGKRKGNPDSCLAGQLDMLLTSVGTAENPLGFGNGRLLASLGPKLESLKDHILGDVGGVLLPRVPDKPTPLVQMIERRWQGVRRRHIEACAERAAREDPSTGRPGSVVLSLGAGRAEIIKAAVAAGLVSHLIIDHELESALEDLLAS